MGHRPPPVLLLSDDNVHHSRYLISPHSPSLDRRLLRLLGHTRAGPAFPLVGRGATRRGRTESGIGTRRRRRGREARGRRRERNGRTGPGGHGGAGEGWEGRVGGDERYVCFVPRVCQGASSIFPPLYSAFPCSLPLRSAVREERHPASRGNDPPLSLSLVTHPSYASPATAGRRTPGNP